MPNHNRVAFVADLTIDGRYAGPIENDGNGSPTSYFGLKLQLVHLARPCTSTCAGWGPGAIAALASAGGSPTPDAMPTGLADHTDPAFLIRLDVDNGDRCRLRKGGSWGVPEADPSLVGWYYCTKADAVRGKRNAGFEKSGATWMVTTGNETGPLTKHKVTTAYFVATAP
jgi:hypothetical protein